MSGSEAGGVMASSRGGEPFTQNMRLTFSADGAALYKPVAVSGAASPPYQAPSATGNGGSAEGPASGGPPLFAHGLNMNMSSGEPVKRKRGRPRKYGPDGTMSLTLTPGTKGSSAPQSAGFPSPAAAVAVPTGGSVSPNSMKKSRGRPPGLGRKKQLEALGSVGIGFTPHVITVKAGEDVSSKIMSFSQNGPRAVCILSANGAISNVTLRQPSISGGTVTYEGRYEILSLSGSFMLSESGGHRSRTGGLSVSLSGADGRVLGGGVAGLLTAASPVQVVVGSFMSDSRKESKSPKQADPFSGTTMLGHSGGFAGGSSPSHGTLSESSGGPGSPLNQSSGPCNNSNPQRLESMPWK
ncbi:AT-hook motif nuclear-localized protein 10 [Punica granatum]|uniref:AT-hook motif nuclear-localized protein n=1 Tax=Punica granatum TaxID=22663 RepID=A0A218X7E0_PUNGR|nr:AT-hook motif nuclear-localized protein 10 [Punica granatum]XP_031388795.1 AT-hook motif nuclear-localized protein 10 [Punica granatum]XP_031388804.1 AT-hook motif nuclear-localized protein 10 [Punica granatum]OWM81155.1 hypothetical protein CDL15_Pgr007186 [Punica granatum]